MTALPLPDLFIKPDFDNSMVTITASLPSVSVGTWSINDSSGSIGEGKTDKTDKVNITAAMPDFTPWSTENPHLYTFTITINGKAHSRPFGMTKTEVRNNRIYFNNKPLYVRGHIRGREAHDHPDLRGEDLTAYYERNIRLSKEYGFNFIRFHSKIPPDEFFEAADRLGILTHVEIRKYYGKYQKERELMDHDPVLVKPKDWQEEVLRVRNHPSLLVYCMGNEINNPGNNPQVKAIFDLTRELDDSRLFIDTCARGQYDRGNVDLDVQHMSYFCPFGRNYHMFETTSNWGIFGSVEDKAITEINGAGKTVREIPVNFPVLAHEICHYTSYRDIDGLEKKFDEFGTEKPWWLAELKALRALKNLEGDWPAMLKSSKQFQYAWWKQGIESARKSGILGGYHFLQLADTDLYENSNSPLDCFDDHQNCSAEEFKAFNGDCVLIADLPERCFAEKQTFEIPVWLSHFAHEWAEGSAILDWSLQSIDSDTINIFGRMTDFTLAPLDLRRICTLHIELPELDQPEALILKIRFTSAENNEEISANEWNLWAYPDRPQRTKHIQAEFNLQDIDLRKRYADIPRVDTPTSPDILHITDRFSPEIIQHLEDGGSTLMLYRIAENRDYNAERETLYLPSTRDRFKGTIWDRGHQLGGFLREHPLTSGFPHQGFIDFQFARLIDDADKISLDDFPASVTPLIQGNDKAARDRFDVYTFGLRELQPAWSLRRFTYLFELQVGKGRLLVCGFNFSGIEMHLPEVSYLFEELMLYADAQDWSPSVEIASADLKSWLEEQGSASRIMERKMTQYWQIDAEPLESAQYWEDSENRIKAEMKRGLDSRERHKPLSE